MHTIGVAYVYNICHCYNPYVTFYSLLVDTYNQTLVNSRQLPPKNNSKVKVDIIYANIEPDEETLIVLNVYELIAGNVLCVTNNTFWE